MSTILRTPYKVPSLFAQGLDQPPRVPPRLSVSQWMDEGLMRVWEWSHRDADAALARFIPALLCSSALLTMVGKPLVRAASLAAGLGPMH